MNVINWEFAQLVHQALVIVIILLKSSLVWRIMKKLIQIAEQQEPPFAK